MLITDIKKKSRGSVAIDQSFNPRSFLAHVGAGRSISKYPKDRVVFSQGDPADAVFYIQKGKVKITVVSEQGKEAVVAILGAHDFFGEACLAGQTQRTATVETMTDCAIARLEKTAMSTYSVSNRPSRRCSSLIF